jgi:toxin ParE1/3/4
MPEKNRRIVWAPAAKRDLRKIWRYFVHVASPDVADRLLRDIVRASELASQRPLAWRARDDVRPGLRSILAHPYVVFYRVAADAVQIARVVHQRQDLTAIFRKTKG